MGGASAKCSGLLGCGGHLVVFIKSRLWARLTSCITCRRLMGPTACAEPPLVRRRVLPKGGKSLAQLPRHFLVHPPLGRCRSGTPFLSRWKVFGPVVGLVHLHFFCS